MEDLGLARIEIEMSEIKQIPVQVAARSGESVGIQLQMMEWSEKERTHRAIRVGLIGGGLTLVSLFLPIAHFILVPLGIILTPFFARRAYAQKVVYPTQSIVCPKCGATVQWPLSFEVSDRELLCEKCRSVLKITRC